jgi:hypothetical protein
MMMAPETRGVRFYNKVKVKTIPVIADIALEDRSATWFSAEEYAAIKKRERTLASRLVVVSSKGGEQRCALKKKEAGLLSMNDRIRRRIAYDNGKRCVLLEQIRQWEKDDGSSIDRELLAEMYSEFSKKSVQEALDRGKSIALRVRKYSRGSPSSPKKAPSKDTMSKEELIHQRWTITAMDSELVPTRRHPSKSPPNGFLKPSITRTGSVLAPFERPPV